MAEKFYTTHQASKFCNVYPTTVINWIKEGLLPAYTTPGGHRRIKREDLLALMKRNRMPIPEELSKGVNRVIAIDDDPKILQMIKTILTSEGLEVGTADNAFQAGALISNWPPDLILLDILMPEIDGFEVCKSLKADEKTKDIPIIAVTAVKDPKEIEKMLSVGITDHVFKPFKSQELVEKIKAHLSIG